MASFNSVMRFDTVLDAVNTCLRTIGTDQVDTYLDTEDADILAILQELDTADKRIQANSGDGWSFNADSNVLLMPSSDGFIHLPVNTLQVTAAYMAQFNNFGGDQILLLTERPTGLLYDMTNKTNTFTSPQMVDIVTRQDFEDLPQIARTAIGLEGALRWQSKYNGNMVLIKVESDDADEAFAELLSWDDARPQNSINANKTVLQTLYGYQGLRRQRGAW